MLQDCAAAATLGTAGNFRVWKQYVAGAAALETKKRFITARLSALSVAERCFYSKA